MSSPYETLNRFLTEETLFGLDLDCQVSETTITSAPVEWAHLPVISMLGSTLLTYEIPAMC